MILDEKTKETMKLLAAALQTALVFATEKGHAFKPFKISTSSKETRIVVDGVAKKIGFGSSAAVVVATVAAVLDYLGCTTSKEEIYKLSTIAHFYAQGKVGSAFDVAASTYGGVFVYSRFDPVWLTKQMESTKPLAAIVSEQWPGLFIEPLMLPNDLKLVVGWTKESASTSAMIKQLDVFKQSQPERYKTLMNDIAATARSVEVAWKQDNKERIIGLLQNNEKLLRQLTQASGVSIETPELKLLSDIAAKHNAGGKLSGAGGGDCGIAICYDDATARKIRNDWKATGLYPLDVTIDRDGVRKD